MLNHCHSNTGPQAHSWRRDQVVGFYYYSNKALRVLARKIRPVMLVDFRCSREFQGPR